jgi:hypothetical protein
MTWLLHKSRCRAKYRISVYRDSPGLESISLRLARFSELKPASAIMTLWGRPSNFLQCSSVNTPRHLILRQVDDVPVVGSNGTVHCEQFTNAYKSVCAELHVQLAEDCPLNDKAFSCQKRGKVLGVMFDSTDLSWRMSENKICKAKMTVKKALCSVTSTLKEWQKLMGR